MRYIRERREIRVDRVHPVRGHAGETVVTAPSVDAMLGMMNDIQAVLIELSDGRWTRVEVSFHVENVIVEAERAEP